MAQRTVCKKSWLRFVAVFSLILIFGAVSAGAATLKLKFSHQNNVYDADQLLAETFKKLLEEKTNGAITVTIYPGTDRKSVV